MIQELLIEYSGPAINAPTTELISFPLPTGTILAVRATLYGRNVTGDAIFNFRLNGIPEFTTELTIPSGSSQINHTGLSIAVVAGDKGSFSLAGPLPTSMPDPDWGFIITYEGGIGTADEVHAATGKTTPVDADEIGLVDSAASYGLKKLTWANLKAGIKSYYDSVTATLTNKTLTNPANTAQTLTDAATISWDAASGATASVTLGGARTLAAPTNLKTGGRYALKVVQDGSGSRTLTWNAVFKWPAATPPTLSTAAGKVDLVTCVSFDGTNLLCRADIDLS